MDEMDELLAELKAEYQAVPTQQSSPKTSINPNQTLPKTTSATSLNNLLEELKEEFDSHNPNCTSKQINPHQIKINQSPENHSDSLINNLQQEYQEQDRIAEAKKQELILAKKLKQQAALNKKAQQWLNNLDPNSDEGLWFEEFADAYDSKLAAAIDYLQAIKEVQ